MKIKANLMYEPSQFQLSTCQVEKVVELSGLEFDQFLAAPQEDHPFIEENRELMYQWNGVDHCLLVLGRDRTDGVLVEAEGHSCARYAAYVPEARAIVEAQLEQAVDLITRRSAEDPETGRRFFHLEELEERLGLTIRKGNGLAEMLLDVLSHREEIAEAKLVDGSIVVSCCPEFCGQLHGADDAQECIRALKIEPGSAPEVVTMPNTLEAFQAAVGGYIEALTLESGVCLICNEEGKLIGLPANRRVGGDIIAGTFLIVGEADGDFCSISDEDAAHYAEEFAQPLLSYGGPEEPTQWEFHVF